MAELNALRVFGWGWRCTSAGRLPMGSVRDEPLPLSQSGGAGWAPLRAGHWGLRRTEGVKTPRWSYPSKLRAMDGAWFAWAMTETLAFIISWFFVSCALSYAISASTILDRAASVFSRPVFK